MIEDKLHIAVCVKQTLSSTSVSFGSGSSGSSAQYALNPFDEYAVEEAVQIRERLGGKAVVTAVSLGKPEAVGALREAIARGADQAVLVSGAELEGGCASTTALTLCAALRKLGEEKGAVDLVLTGKQTNDSDTGQVGLMLAAHLDAPGTAFVSKIETVEAGSPGKVVVHRSDESGIDVLEMSLPAVLGVTKEINEPRIPSLKGKMAAKKAQIPTWGVSELGVEAGTVGSAGSLVEMGEPYPVPAREAGAAIPGETVQEKAGNLLAKLKEGGLV